METQHQTGKQPEKAQKSNENEQPFSETTPLLPSQMALANPNPNTLTPATINALQRTHGNHYVTSLVQRMRLTQSPPFLIRRRVPEAGDIDDEALETADAGANAANVGGLRTLLRRVVQDIEDARLRREFLARQIDGVPVQQVIETGTADQLLTLIRQMEADPQLQPYVLTDTTRTMVTTRQSHDFARVREVVRELHQQMTEIGTTAAHDVHLQAVFGEHPQYGWQQAKARFPLAANGLRRALHRNMMGADRTGAAEEMQFGALTEYATRMRFMAEYIDNPDTIQAKQSFVHESFHFTFEDVRDEGGYTRDDAFRHRSAQAKFTNAEHYTEVYLRVIGQSRERGARYVPQEGGSDTRTPNQRAFDQAAEETRRAWDAGMDVHDFIRDCYNQQQSGRRLTAQQAASVLHHSQLFRLTYHRRGSDVNTAINEIDIALAESLVRRLSDAQNVFRDTPVILPDNSGGWPLTVDDYIRNAVSRQGIIVDNTERDVQMVHYMSRQFEDLPTTQIPPPRELM